MIHVLSIIQQRRQWHPSTLAWKISWTEVPGRLQSIGVSKSWTRLSNFTFTFHFHALEKEMATHSSVLAWTIPGMAEPGGLLSIGSHRVGHDWSDLAAAAIIQCKWKLNYVSLFSHVLSHSETMILSHYWILKSPAKSCQGAFKIIWPSVPGSLEPE